MGNELIGGMKKVAEVDGHGPVYAGMVKLDNDNTTRIYFTPFGTVGVKEIFGRED